MDIKEMNSKICCFLVILSMIVYCRVIRNEFVHYDDDTYIFKNPYIQTGISIDNIKWAFTTDHGGNWHPLTWISHMTDSQLFGMKKAGWHHLVNLLWHVINTVLLFIMLSRMTGAVWQSAFVAALFAVHPLNVETVAWASERKSVLSTFFWFMTILLYINYVKSRSIKSYVFSILFFLMGLLSKPMVVTLPFVLLLLDFWPLNRTPLYRTGADDNQQETTEPHDITVVGTSLLNKLLFEKVPFFILAMIFCIVTLFVQESAGSVASLDAIPFSSRITNALLSYFMYIYMMVWPVDLAVLYPHSGMPQVWQYTISGIFLISVTFLVVKAARRFPYLGFGWFWYLGTLVPVIGIVQAGGQSMADRYAYLPLIGIFIMIAWGVSDIPVKKHHFSRSLYAGLAAVIIFAFSCVTFVQTGYWKNSIALFKRTVSVTKGNYVMYNNLGNAYMRVDRLDDAMFYCREALKIKPNSIEVLNNLGNILLKKGEVDEAVSLLAKAMKINPNHMIVRKNLQRGLMMKRQKQSTLPHVASEQKTPGTVEFFVNMGVALAKQGRSEEALAQIDKAIEVDSDYWPAYNSLGIVLLQMGKLDEAETNFKKTIKIKPDYIEAYNNLGILYARQKKIEQAVMQFSKALKINPNYKKAKQNLDIIQKFQADNK